MDIGEIVKVGVELNDTLSRLGISPGRNERYPAEGDSGRRQELINELMKKHAAAQSDPSTPQSYRDDLAKALQGLALQDRFLGVEAEGELGPRPAGAR